MAKQKLTVAVDLDGVLADYSGWRGIGFIDEPLPGAVQFIEDLLASDFKVVIFTTRTNTQVNTQDGEGQGHMDEKGWQGYLTRYVKTWLSNWGFPANPDLSVYDGPGKPLALCYVDDRAIYCDPRDSEDTKAAFTDALNEIQDFKRAHDAQSKELDADQLPACGSPTQKCSTCDIPNCLYDGKDADGPGEPEEPGEQTISETTSDERAAIAKEQTDALDSVQLDSGSGSPVADNDGEAGDLPAETTEEAPESQD